MCDSDRNLDYLFLVSELQYLDAVTPDLLSNEKFSNVK
jgi:hypothetical protein